MALFLLFLLSLLVNFLCSRFIIAIISDYLWWSYSLNLFLDFLLVLRSLLLHSLLLLWLLNYLTFDCFYYKGLWWVRNRSLHCFLIRIVNPLFYKNNLTIIIRQIQILESY
jgi:hypothetical protein